MQKSALVVRCELVINGDLDAALLWIFAHTASFMSKLFHSLLKKYWKFIKTGASVEINTDTWLLFF